MTTFLIGSPTVVTARKSSDNWSMNSMAPYFQLVSKPNEYVSLLGNRWEFLIAIGVFGSISAAMPCKPITTRMNASSIPAASTNNDAQLCMQLGIFL